ncbi:MAG: metallophosphoesterase [Lachnospiraceae bacterium]
MMLIFLSAVLLCISIWLLYERYEHEAVEITTYSHPAPGLLAGRELRFCVLSDLHNNKKRCEKDLWNSIRAYQPDAFLICGDMVDKHKKDNQDALHFLEELARMAPIFYSYGNHESELKERFPDAWECYVAQIPKNCMLLDNRSVTANDWIPEAENLQISGLTLPDCFYGKGTLFTDEEALPELAMSYRLSEKPSYHILLAHHPEYDKMYKKYAPDLILSGHLHGGLIRLPFIGGLVSPRYRFPKKDSGFYLSGNSTLFISRGLGSHTIPLRVFNRTEMTLLTLVPAGETCVEEKE